MGIQILLWSMLFVPWLTLFFMKKESIKRFMPVGILSALSVIIINELGLSYNWWSFKETAFPLQHFLPHYLGLFPVMTMWIFYFTYRKFWLFLIVEIVANLGFSFLFVCYFLPVIGVLYTNNMTGIMVFCLSTGLAIALYGYHIWQEGIFVHPYREGSK
jgi:hypothetical protein